MADLVEPEDDDTLKVEGDDWSSARIISAIKKAERAFNSWQALCDEIDEVYSKREINEANWSDPEYDLFWASSEILKPAIYARPPQPVVSPQFKDRRKLPNVTAELLERSVTSGFGRTNLDESMLCVRDDLIFYNRGQLWVTYESDDGQKVCVDHIDRKDFVHPPARKWMDVPWVAKRAWLTKQKMRKRFASVAGHPDPGRWEDAKPARPTRNDEQSDNHGGKVPVWEVWHKEDDKVYWVAEGVDVILDKGDPHLSLRGFFPCPRPAFGTLRPRTLEPIPDYVRYAPHFAKINSLTRRIYALLDRVRMKGLIPAGGDIGDAIEQAMNDDSSAELLIPVPMAAFAGGADKAVAWLPLDVIVTAITGLIEARRELFSDFDRLSGISDIMRGETEAEETLGAQQLKSQYGSVRVREKIDELQRLARDVTEIAAEIMAERFTSETLLEMSQMEVPTKAEIKKKVEAAEKDAKDELREIGEQAEKMMAEARAQGQEPDPAQARQQLKQAQQAVMQKFGPILRELSEAVPLEDVIKLLRDERARGFAFEIETDSTVLTDELQEKQSRGEFMEALMKALGAATPIAALGPPAAKLMGEVIKFALQPYRVGREMNAVIDEFVDAAPQMAEAAKGGEGEDTAGLAEANMKLAEAEIEKAKAATMKVQADMAKNEAENQRKMGELQAAYQKDQADMAAKMADAETKAGDAATKAQETAAKVDKMRAETAKILASIGLDARKQDLDEYQAASDVQLRQTDQAMGAEKNAQDAERADREQMIGASQSEQEGQRADRQQDFSERQGERADERADRQQTFAEQEARRERADA